MIIKIGLVLLTGAGLGFGVDKLATTEMFPNDGDGYYEHMDGDSYYGHMGGEYWHNDDDDFLEHMLEDLTVEDQVLVQVKIDQLLIDYDITLEELNNEYEVRYDFMIDLMEFLDLNEIDYHNHMDGDSYYGHMGGGYCHDDGDFLEHMLEDLTVEEQVLVQEKIDQLLVDYSVTIEELNDDYDVRYDFMTDLMEFLDLNEINYHNHGGFDHYNDEDDWHGGMGMH